MTPPKPREVKLYRKNYTCKSLRNSIHKDHDLIDLKVDLEIAKQIKRKIDRFLALSDKKNYTLNLIVQDLQF